MSIKIMWLKKTKQTYFWCLLAVFIFISMGSILTSIVSCKGESVMSLGTGPHENQNKRELGSKDSLLVLSRV